MLLLGVYPLDKALKGLKQERGNYNVEMECQAKIRLVILGTDLQKAVSTTLTLGQSPI